MAQKSLALTHDFRFSGAGVADFPDPVETNAEKIEANFVELFALASAVGRQPLDVDASFVENAEAITANFDTLGTALEVECDPIDEAADFLYTGEGVPGADEQVANAAIIDANFDALYEAA